LNFPQPLQGAAIRQAAFLQPYDSIGITARGRSGGADCAFAGEFPLPRRGTVAVEEGKDSDSTEFMAVEQGGKSESNDIESKPDAILNSQLKISTQNPKIRKTHSYYDFPVTQAVAYLLSEHGRVISIARRTRERSRTHVEADWIYRRGEPADFMIIVLSGLLMLQVGRDGFRQEAGVFTVLALQSLGEHDFVPDFSAAVQSQRLILVKVSRTAFIQTKILDQHSKIPHFDVSRPIRERNSSHRAAEKERKKRKQLLAIEQNKLQNLESQQLTLLNNPAQLTSGQVRIIMDLIPVGLNSQQIAQLLLLPGAVQEATLQQIMVAHQSNQAMVERRNIEIQRQRSIASERGSPGSVVGSANGSPGNGGPGSNLKTLILSTTDPHSAQLH
jgi:hypothetical protein